MESIISCGGVAQLGERLARIQKVRGSIPLVSTSKFKALQRCRAFLFFAYEPNFGADFFLLRGASFIFQYVVRFFLLRKKGRQALPIHGSLSSFWRFEKPLRNGEHLTTPFFHLGLSAK